MNGDHFDELDRALFALDLEEPPADLRGAILRSTIHDPAVAAVPEFATAAPATARPWNAILVGTSAAVAVWLILAAFFDRALAESIAEGVGAFGHLLNQPTAPVWLGLGALTVLAVQLADALPRRLPLGGGRS